MTADHSDEVAGRIPATGDATPARSDAALRLRRNLFVAMGAMVTIFVLGTIGYYGLGGGRWTLGDCAYMTVISLTTVGYGEVLRGLREVPNARLFTTFVLIAGASIAVYSMSVMTTFLVEGEFLNLRRRRRNRKMVDKLTGHVIVCGAGRTGVHVVDELFHARWPFVVIDVDQGHLARCEEDCKQGGPMAQIHDDATDDKVLLRAGIERAHGIVAALPEDKDNLYVVVTARDLNPKLRIVAKAIDPRAGHKLQVAGADEVVMVNQLGGVQLASQMIRPAVVGFLDKMTRGRDQTLRFEELKVPESSALVRKPLAQTDIRKERNLLVVAVRARDDAGYTYSPGPDFVLEAGMTLIVIGETDAVDRLRKSPFFEGA